MSIIKFNNDLRVGMRTNKTYTVIKIVQAYSYMVYDLQEKGTNKIDKWNMTAICGNFKTE